MIVMSCKTIMYVVGSNLPVYMHLVVLGCTLLLFPSTRVELQRGSRRVNKLERSVLATKNYSNTTCKRAEPKTE